MRLSASPQGLSDVLADLCPLADADGVAPAGRPDLESSATDWQAALLSGMVALMAHMTVPPQVGILAGSLLLQNNFDMTPHLPAVGRLMRHKHFCACTPVAVLSRGTRSLVTDCRTRCTRRCI